MQYVINSNSLLSGALQHVLKNIAGIRDDSIDVSARTPHQVTFNGHTYKGLQAILLALRIEAKSPEQQAFLGLDEETVALVNQWVCVAATLDVDAARTTVDASTSIAKTVFADVERALATGNASEPLIGGSRPTIADLLLYTALFSHPAGQAEAQPATLAWAALVQEDAHVALFRSATVKAVAPSKAAATKAEVTYVKPSEEEILRRRAEKEAAKVAKEAAKAAAAAAGGGVAATSKSEAAGEAKALAGPSSKVNKPAHDSTSLYVRVGQLTNLRRHPEADRLYVEDMVLGDETRTIVSGLVEHYTPEELEGTYCLVVCNMKPKALMGVTSQGMVLCAKQGDKVKLIRPPAGAQPGDRILFGAAYDAAVAAAAAPEPLSGNKMSEVLSHLHTDSTGALCWREECALHLSGERVAIIEMPDCPVS